MYVNYPDEGLKDEAKRKILRLVKSWVSAYGMGKWSKEAKEDPSLSLTLDKAYDVTTEEITSDLKNMIFNQMTRKGLNLFDVPYPANYQVKDMGGYHLIAPRYTLPPLLPNDRPVIVSHELPLPPSLSPFPFNRFKGDEGKETIKHSLDDKDGGSIWKFEGFDNGGISYQADLGPDGRPVIRIVNGTGRAFSMTMEYGPGEDWVRGEASIQDGRRCRFGFMGKQLEGRMDMTMNVSRGLSVDASYVGSLIVLTME